MSTERHKTALEEWAAKAEQERQFYEMLKQLPSQGVALQGHAKTVEQKGHSFKLAPGIYVIVYEDIVADPQRGISIELLVNGESKYCVLEPALAKQLTALLNTIEAQKALVGGTK